MRGAFLVAPRQIEVRDDLDAPACQPGTVVLRVRACGICGGDLKTYRYHDGPFPSFIGGHEFAGEVTAVGAEVGGLAPGDPVVRCFGNFCGTCTNCRLGSPNFCTGVSSRGSAGAGFSEYLATPAPNHGRGLFRKPAGLPWVHAGACEPATCAIGAALIGEPLPGQWAAVVGLGAIGHFVVQTLSAMGVRVVGIDVSKRRLEAAAPFCAEVVDSSSQDPVGAVREITGGVGADRAYEAVGIEPTFAAAIQMTRMGGIAVLVGVFREPMKSFDPEWIFRRDLTVVGAKGPSPLMTPQGGALVLDYIERGIIRPETVVMAFPLSRAGEAFAAQAASECLKAVIVPDGEAA